MPDLPTGPDTIDAEIARVTADMHRVTETLVGARIEAAILESRVVVSPLDKSLAVAWLAANEHANTIGDELHVVGSRYNDLQRMKRIADARAKAAAAEAAA